MKTKISSEEESELIRRYKAGEAVKTIYTSMDISKSSFYNVIRRLNAGTKRAHVTLDEQQTLVVAQRYVAGENAYALADEFGVHAQTVYNILARRGIKTRLEPKRLDADEKLLVASACASGGTIKATAEAFGIGETTVHRILRSEGVEMQTGRPPVHDVNHTAFDAITPASAYWLGFLFADGCVAEDGLGAPALVCMLAEKDAAHLEKLRAFLGSTHSISRVEKTATSKGGPFVRFSVRSAGLCAALRRYGVIAKKVRVPVSELAESRDFWRGMVDGDGSIGAYASQHYVYPDIRLSGQIPLLNVFQRFLSEKGFEKTRTVPSGEYNGSVWEVRLRNSKALELIRMLYSSVDPSIALARKQARAESMMWGRVEQSVSYEKPARVSSNKID